MFRLRRAQKDVPDTTPTTHSTPRNVRGDNSIHANASSPYYVNGVIATGKDAQYVNMGYTNQQDKPSPEYINVENFEEETGRYTERESDRGSTSGQPGHVYATIDERNLI